ncbi:MAG TPA: carboxypeptidase regulatory-like domain-containing protein [Blastocatellia bacterium]|nr:carboxypeptidase regulatory-like domain-containing protein [Blastocatellia bacterium]
MKLLAIPLAVFLSISAFAQETKPQREGAISGRVVADDGQPMSGAQVSAVSVGRSRLAGATQMTNCDADGNFKVTGLSSGVYSLLARSPGYVSVQGQSRKYRIGENAIIRMSRGGVITGRVTDEFGEPMVGVRVSADRVRDSEGQPNRSVREMNEMNSSRMTDDRGVYRIYGLEPGAYVVGVTGSTSMLPGLGRISSEPPSYHPSSPRGAAVEINLRGAEEVSGVDIRARGGRGRAISGTVSGETQSEGLINTVTVMLLGADKQLLEMTTLINGQNFSLRGVEDGEYELVAMRFSETLDFAASAPRRVAVKGADVNGVELKLMKLGSISGRVVVEAPKEECKTADQFKVEETLIELKRDDPSPGLLALGLFQQTPGASSGSAAPEKDGNFTVKSLEAGHYWINTDLPDENWYVRAITQSATPKLMNVSRAGVMLKQGEKKSGIEIIIAQGAASLSGRVVPASEGAQLPKRLRAHLIPAEAAAADDLLRHAESPVRGDGSFEFKHMAPGKYLLHTRQVTEKEVDDDQARPIVLDTAERVKLRRDASAAKNEIELKPCERVKEHVLRLKP